MDGNRRTDRNGRTVGGTASGRSRAPLLPAGRSGQAWQASGGSTPTVLYDELEAQRLESQGPTRTPSPTRHATGVVTMTRFHIVSDVHGAGAALARAADGSDVFVCLGDLILFLDYDDPRHGIFADLLGADHAAEYIRRRTNNEFDEARRLSDAAWRRLGIEDPAQRRDVIMEKVREQYAELFDALPRPALLTYGNVDVPSMWQDYLQPDHRVLDAEVIDIDGLRCGFIGGGLVSPMRTPYELTEAEYANKVDALGPVDVLFTHIPPRLPELTYDTVARRFEFGSEALLEYVHRYSPRYHFFGHVHQPLAQRTRIGRTEAINVGHFNARRAPFAIDIRP